MDKFKFFNDIMDKKEKKLMILIKRMMEKETG